MNKKKKILLLADDLRMFSGVATMSREMVLGTAHVFDWVQIGGAIKHPENGRVADLSAETNKLRNINNAYLKIYPTDGYGHEDLLFHVMDIEKPDAILHFTDPRFWTWLYMIEKQIRSKIPLCYYNIWDDLPYPMYNRPYYESCDALLSISKQTFNINKWVLGPDNVTTLSTENKSLSGKTLIHYVPHGINCESFKPLPKDDKKLLEIRKKIFGGNDKKYDFVLFFNSRNTKRKQPSNIILAYRAFLDNLPKEKAKKCVLLMHTEIIHEAGTNLISVKEALCPEYDIIFSQEKILPEDMNYYYNIADVTVNASSNEGFGLSSAESIMAGTPIVVNVTGGLQDQIGQKDDEGNQIEFSQNFGSNNVGKYKNHGKWVKPVWPASRDIQGSIPTPYIFDDLCRWEDLAEAFMYWYLTPLEKREEAGLEGRRWAMGEGGLNSVNMCNELVKSMSYVFDNWSPVKRFAVYGIESQIGNKTYDNSPGFEIPKIDIDKLKGEIEKL